MPRRTASVLVAALAATALLAPLAPATAAPATAAPKSVEAVVKKLVRKVNKGDRHGARKVAKRKAVGAMFDSRDDGFRFDKPLGANPCPPSGSGELSCGIGLLFQGQIVGSAYIELGWTSGGRLVATDAVIILGERTAARVAPRTINFPGGGIEVPRGTDPAILTGTPADFQAFVTARLDELWAYTDNDPVCATSPLVEVRKYSTKGYAQIGNEGIFGDLECASGGNAAIYVKWKGVWQAPLVTQEFYKCRKLRTYDVPRKIADRSCYEHGEVVRYRP